MKAAGIYVIIHRESAKAYVGSSMGMDARWRWHLSQLRRGIHCNRMLQRAWTKYGEEAFSHEVLDTVGSAACLHVRETYWINALGACHPQTGYNLAPVGGSCFGFKHSAETRQKMSEVRSAYTSPETRRLRGLAWVGRKHTEETKAKMAAAGRLRRLSDEQKARISAVHKGKTLSEETRRKLSEARTGKVPTEETRAKISAALKGRVITPEWRAKLSEAAKRRTKPQPPRADTTSQE